MAKEHVEDELKRPERAKPLCWRRSVDHDYCDRPQGHAGLCSWEAAATITQLYQEINRQKPH